MIKKLPLLALLIWCQVLHTQNFILSGKISGGNEALPFATIIIKGTTAGTNSNANGMYSLKLPAGHYEIVYQYIGFTKKIIAVDLNSDKELNVNLLAEGVSLKEVEIKAGEDPSYPIIRKAIKKRKYYRDQLNSYSCKAYIKGLQKISNIPKNIKGLIKISGGDLSDTLDMKGVVYLSESESKYYYRKPNDEKEIMYSSKISGDNKSFSFNQLSDTKMNFYDNLVEISNLSDRPFTSPIHDNAFLFYRFYLLGSINSEGKIIHKIKVVPKRKTDPCFRGIIYIQDSTWRFTSVDLMLTKDAKIDFVDTLTIKQLYNSVIGDSIWMPITLNFGFDFKAFGFKGKGYFNANIKEYDLQPVFPKKFFKNELLKVEDGANKKDSVYWVQNRAVPLTQEEINDYRQKDSISKIRDTDKYKDSVDKKSNRLKFSNIILGYNYTNTRKRFRISLPGIVTNGVQYNTVEGLNLSYKFSINKSYEDFRQYTIYGRSRYGFSNKLWGGELGFFYFLKPEKFRSFGFKIKSIVEQFNPSEPILPLVNSFYTLLLNQNYMKLYKETGVEANYFSELINGLYLSSTVRYMQRDPLKNSTDKLLIDDKKILFSSNNPTNSSGSDLFFSTNRVFTAEVNFQIQFKQKYYTLPHQKIISGSKYPKLTVGYKRAFPILGATADFDVLNASVYDDVKLGLFGKFSYRLKSGRFLTAKKLYFMDFKHVMGNQTIVNTSDYLSSFRLLPYYIYSADKWFVEAHAEHHFNGFIINKIPLIKKLNVQEVVGAHFLSNNKVNYYYEINFGIEKIFKILRFDYVLGYTANAKLKQGFTFGINLSI
jgi:hypothetical protein